MIAEQMRGRRSLLVATVMALIVLTVTVYWPVFSCDFVNIDDNEYVTSNGPVMQGLSTYGWIYAWTTLDQANWHPLMWLSLELDTSLWGPKPAGYHVTNLVFHTANCLLLFGLLYRLFGSISRSAIVAALFAVHPLHVESVAWISERKDVLSGFFLLLTLLAYCHYARRPTIIRFGLVGVLFFLGLCAKSMLVTLPLLLILFDQWPLQRIRWTPNAILDARFPAQPVRAIVVEKTPLLCLSLAIGIVTIIAQRGATHVVKHLTFVDQLANVLNSYFWYLKKTFIPTGLTAFYPHPGPNVPGLSVAAGGIVCVVLTLWTFRQRQRQPYLVFGWGWFLIALLPVIGLLQVGGQAYADRYSYIPHLGLFIGLIWWCHSWLATSKRGRTIGSAVAFLTIAVCAGLSYQQIRYWQNSRSLWAHALDVDPQNGTAHLMYANLLLIDGDNQRAIEHLEKGFQLVTSQPMASPYVTWGRALEALNRNAEAEEKYQAAIKIAPDYVPALDALWQLYLKQQREAEADQIEKQIIQTFTSIAERNPYSAMSQMTVGQIELVLGNPEKALAYFERAVLLSPRNANAVCGLAMAQLDLNRPRDAKANLRRAIELEPGLALAHFKLGEILEFERDLPSAKSQFEQAARLEPGNEEYRQRLAHYLNRQ